MNTENPVVNPAPAPVPPAPTPALAPKPQKPLGLAKTALKNFYSSKKKLFKSLAIVLGILLVVLIAALGYLAFRNQGQSSLGPYPTPETSPISDTTEVNENEVKLGALKEEIIKLDIFQKRLAPPIINFKISF